MLNLRPEQAADVAAVKRINDLAFGRAEEAGLIADLRQAGDLTLSLVATDENGLIGHISFSPVTVKDSVGEYPAQSLSTMAVLPERQNQGVGGRLVREGLMLLAARGCQGLVVLGHAAYYPRFGFVRASTLGLSWEHEAPDEAFMALELREGFFSERGGVVRYHPAFDRFV